VHGSRIKPAERHAAEKTAEDLAKAVVSKAVRHGWPEAGVLNRLALSGRPDCSG
jgi:hypothetical protein